MNRRAFITGLLATTAVPAAARVAPLFLGGVEIVFDDLALHDLLDRRLAAFYAEFTRVTRQAIVENIFSHQSYAGGLAALLKGEPE